MHEHGYPEGQNIAFEFRSANGEPDRPRELAGELVRLKANIIVAHLTPAVVAARQATTEISIVMAWAGDPVGMGFVASLARPSANITGLAGTGPEIAAKVLEFIRKVLPSARRVGVLVNSADPHSNPFIEQIEKAGNTLEKPETLSAFLFTQSGCARFGSSTLRLLPW